MRYNEYTLDKDAVKMVSGTFRHPERIFPDLAVKSRHNYPGMQAGLKAKNTNSTAFVLVPRDTEQARSIFKNYAEQYLQGILSRNSGIGYYNNIKKELCVAGRMKLLEGFIVHVEGLDYPSVDQAIERSALIMQNPEANFFRLSPIPISICCILMDSDSGCWLITKRMLRCRLGKKEKGEMQPAVRLIFQRRYAARQMGAPCTEVSGYGRHPVSSWEYRNPDS